jgi:hypothetical protein
MYRCVVIHRNGVSELQEVQPALHQKLRHLEFKRFVLEFVRSADGISSTAPVYCQFTPSPWQTSNAAKLLWGRRTGTFRLLDEDGQLVQDDMAATGTPYRGVPTVPSSAGAPTSARSAAEEMATLTSDSATITGEDVELVNALARYVEETTSPDATFGTVPRHVVVRKIRALATRLAAQLASQPPSE